MSGYTRQLPLMGASRKRKEREAVGPDAAAPLATKAEPGLEKKPAAAAAGNRLLAGYLAHEFLTRGTLLGQRWDPARPVKGDGPAAGRPEAYADVARLMHAEGAHIPGVVNPTQLGRWLQM